MSLESEKLDPPVGFLTWKEGYDALTGGETERRHARGYTNLDASTLRNTGGALKTAIHLSKRFPNEKEEIIRMNRPVRRYVEKYEQIDFAAGGIYHARMLQRTRHNQNDILEYLNALDDLESLVLDNELPLPWELQPE